MSAGALLVALALVLVNGFFVASEFAIVKVRATRLRELASGGHAAARAALEAIGRLDAYLSACQVGVTLASLGLGWVGEPAFSQLFRPLLRAVGVGSPAVLHSLSASAAFAVITTLHLTLGEQAPKLLAIRRSEATTLWVARPLRWFFHLLRPALWGLNAASNGVLRLFGLRPGEGHESVASEEELRLILAESSVRGLIPRTRGRMIENVLRLGRRTVRQVMVPRAEMRVLSVAAGWEQNRKTIVDGEYTRYPLVGKSLDEVLGIVHVKDMVHAHPPIASSEDLLRIRREAMFVPAQQPLDRLQRDFQARRQHMAIVVDEYGGTSGLVTLEDVLEEVVGEIQDEFDRETPRIVEEAGTFRIDGSTPLDELAASLGEPAPADAEAVTAGGLVLDRLGRIPRDGDEVRFGRYALVVEEMRGRRVARLKARPVVEPAAPGPGAGPAA